MRRLLGWRDENALTRIKDGLKGDSFLRGLDKSLGIDSIVRIEAGAYLYKASFLSEKGFQCLFGGGAQDWLVSLKTKLKLSKRACSETVSAKSFSFKSLAYQRQASHRLQKCLTIAKAGSAGEETWRCIFWGRHLSCMKVFIHQKNYHKPELRVSGHLL